YYSLLFFLGALIGWAWQKKAPQNAEEFTYPVASGVIAGGSLMGVLLIFLENGPEMVKKLLGH
ncbi:MAG: OPT/YSL family transporter, partial [Limisphaerales bacterium]